MLSPGNNRIERRIKKLKVNQKIFGTFRYDKGFDAFFAMHSIADITWRDINNHNLISLISFYHCRKVEKP